MCLIGSTTPIILSLGGTGVTISPEATSADNDDTIPYTDIHIISTTSTNSVLQCYSSNTTINTTQLVDNTTLVVDIPLTPITIITVQYPNGTSIDVKNLTEPIGISIPTHCLFC